MVYFEKSYPPPKIGKNYRNNEVIERLKNDFHNKCYLCEDKNLTNLNIEHFKAHRGDKELKYDWDNLFLSCPHCNNLKSDKFNNILNCTKREDRVDRDIKYEMKPFPKEKVKIETLKDDERVKNTTELLDKIYNATDRPIKRLESANLRDKLLNEIMKFQKLLIDYYSDNEELKERAFIKIKYELSNKSPFTAFKRWIIRDNKSFYSDFKEFLE